MLDAQDILQPADAGELREIVAEAVAEGRAVEVRSGGTKRDIGRPGRPTRLVDMSKLSGIVDYEPSELILTARPATPLVDVEALLASRDQMLAFEPWDHGPLFGRSAGEATIGGIVAAGVAGSRRVSAGGVRDHLLGFSAVSGRGELFKGGGKVVKNVTGYDVSKVMAGSWGQLAVLTELTVKVVPKPKATTTLVLRGLTCSSAVRAMSQAMGSPASPAAAAHVPLSDDGPAITAIRIEGFSESIWARADQLAARLKEFAPVAVMDQGEAEQLWRSVREVSLLTGAETLWRIHTAPSRAAALTDALANAGASWLADWAGALVWAGAPANLDMRALVGSFEAHAMLMRGPLALRNRVPARHPEPSGVAALSSRLKQAFDPRGILDPHRFD